MCSAAFSLPLACSAAARSAAHSAARVTTLGALALLLGACSALPAVQPWEKGLLAKPEMGFELDRLEAGFAEHIYASKEAASGGAGVGVSGCGCN